GAAAGNVDRAIGARDQAAGVVHHGAAGSDRHGGIHGRAVGDGAGVGDRYGGAGVVNRPVAALDQPAGEVFDSAAVVQHQRGVGDGTVDDAAGVAHRAGAADDPHGAVHAA